MLRLLIFLYLTISVSINFIVAQQIPIDQARTMPEGALVTVRGIVTNGQELGNIRFVQDETAGIAVFPGSGSQPGFSANVQPGDSIIVSGLLTDFNGLLEISPVLNYQVLEHDRTLPQPKPVSINHLNDALEGQLVSIECLTFEQAGAVFSNQGTFLFFDGNGNSSEIYLGNNHPLLGESIPNGPIRMVAILSQYGDFQLLPRGLADFMPTTCFYLVNQPQQSEISANSFRLEWESNIPATGRLRFGTQINTLDQSVSLSGNTALHSTVIDGLSPGTIYWVQAMAISVSDTIYSEILPFATKSISSGQIKVFFNQGIDTVTSNGILPDGSSYEEVRDELLARINAAQVSIDAAIYNNNRNDLTFALRQASDRGVQVRYIAAQSTGNTALDPSPGFPVIYGNTDALMHNKFMVIDADLADQAWVMSGSLNWTNGNMIQDFNNTIFIQDQSLARTFELEFEEMWGSSGPLPNAATSRFGNQKSDNTPHRFVIGDRQVECYFSPSDRVTDKITSAITQADYQASFAIFSFTKDEIGNALSSQHANGIWVRGIIENINDPGGEYNWLLSNNVPVQDHPPFNLMHHKYLVVDAGYPMADPCVVTGSHNWTQAAESENDENTLIIHDAEIALLFQAEFERRWAETGTFTYEIAGDKFTIYPNPAKDHLFIKSSSAQVLEGQVEMYTMSGQLVKTQIISGPVIKVDLTGIKPGNYFLILKTQDGSTTIPVQKVSP